MALSARGVPVLTNARTFWSVFCSALKLLWLFVIHCMLSGCSVVLALLASVFAYSLHTDHQELCALQVLPICFSGQQPKHWVRHAIVTTHAVRETYMDTRQSLPIQPVTMWQIRSCPTSTPGVPGQALARCAHNRVGIPMHCHRVRFRAGCHDPGAHCPSNT